MQRSAPPHPTLRDGFPTTGGWEHIDIFVAAALLARIRAERAAQAATPKQARSRGSKPAVA